MKNLLFYILMVIGTAFLAFTILVDAYFTTKSKKPIHPSITLTIEQTNELFENAYLSGYRKGRYYANVHKTTPFEIDVEQDSAMIIGKYWLNDSTPQDIYSLKP
jgi:hypothetical protein